MNKKQKIKILATCIFCAILLGVIGYLVYFITRDAIDTPTNDTVSENLFVAKQKQNINSLKTTKDVRSCKEMYDEISLDLKEDKTNNLLGKSSTESENQYNLLWNELNYTFIEQFIAHANNYFKQSDWYDNEFVGEVVAGIKNDDLVEENTPNGIILQGFEKNITCYKDMQSCINRINAITNNLRNFIPVNEISDLKNQTQSLVNQNCIKNKAVESELINRYKNLEEQAKANARLTVTPTTLEYDASEGSITINVDTNVSSWSYGAVNSWLSINRNGSSLTITCAANDNISERTDIFRIEAYGKELKINVKQKGKVLSFSKFPFQIDRIEIGNADYNGNIIDDYGNRLSSNKMRYLKPKIYYTGFADGKSITIYYKIFNSDGKLNYDSYTGLGSAVTIYQGSNNAPLLSWGSSSKSIYSSGTYRIEIWCNGIRCGTRNFTIY